jgi:hypothetical protein
MLNGDMFAFADENEAYMTLDAIKDVNYHFDVTILDMCGLCLADIQSELIPDPDDGWKRGTLSTVKIEHVCDAYLLCMPPMNIKEDKTMATTINKTLTPIIDYNATPEDLERDKKIKEVTEEAEKKILDIQIELTKTLEAIRYEHQEKKAIEREEQQAHAWKRKYDALLKEGFSVEQAWEMTMKSFEMD